MKWRRPTTGPKHDSDTSSPMGAWRANGWISERPGKALVTCPLQAVNTHKADDHHAEDEEIRKEGVATLILFFIFTC